MYNYLYNYFDRKYAGCYDIIYTDTDSLIFNIRGGKDFDIYADMVNDKYYYDLSDYSNDHPIMKYINQSGINKNENKKVIGKMKDEINHSMMTEIVAM